MTQVPDPAAAALSGPPAGTPPAPLTPASPSERIEIIDIVRGVALFGILAANMRGFAIPAKTYFMPHLFWTTLPDRLVQSFIEIFVQGKFITIFAVLFGLGFAAQATRAEGRGSKFGGTYARRLFFLVLIGLAHGLFIWWGDILLVYGLVGFLLFAFRRRKDLTLKIWGTIGYLFIVLVFGAAVAVTTAMGVKIPTPPAVTPAAIQENIAIYAEGSWTAIQQQRSLEAVTMNWGMFPILFMNILGLFLFGLLAWRRGFFQPAPQSLPRYRKAMIWGLAAGTVASATIGVIHWFEPMTTAPTPGAYALFALNTFAVPALSLGYVCAIVLLSHEPRWQARLRRFGAVGRMALTNYLLQSIIGTLIFYSYGLGLFGRAGAAILLIPTVVIFAAQIWFSVWWLNRFRFGPAEWAWRSLTYGKLQPLLRDDRTPLVSQAAA